MASIIITTGNQAGEFMPLGRRISVISHAESLPLQILDQLDLSVLYDSYDGRM